MRLCRSNDFPCAGKFEISNRHAANRIDCKRRSPWPLCLRSCRDCRRPARQLSAEKRSLFDYLIGSSEQRLRDCEAQRFCSLKVDDQFEFGRLLNWQFTWLLSLQYPSCISASLAEDFIAIASVAHKTTRCDIL